MENNFNIEITNKVNTFNLVNISKNYNKNESFQEMLDDLFNGEIKLLSDYERPDKPVKLQHTVCGNIFYNSKRYIIDKKDAGYLCGCSDEKKKKDQQLQNEKFDNKLRKKGLIDYTRLSDYKGCNEKIVLLHVKCNRKIIVTPFNFFRRVNKCSYCHKKEMKERLPRKQPKNEFYQKKIDEMTNGEFLLMSDYYNLSTYIKLKHKICGHEFTARADNFELIKNKCPLCAGRKNYNNLPLSQKIKQIEDLLGNEYELITKDFGISDSIKLRHKKCGNIITRKSSTITDYKKNKKVTIRCEYCELEERKEAFLDELDRNYGDAYGIKSNTKYKGLEKEITFYHKVCGKTFKTKPINMLVSTSNRQYCPACRAEYKENEFKKKILNYYGDEYELVGPYEESSKVVKIRHKKCGEVLEKHKVNLFKRKSLCNKCNKNDEISKNKDIFISKLKEKHGGVLTLKGDYKNIKIKTEFYCSKCKNIFSEIPERLVHSTRKCPFCK